MSVSLQNLSWVQADQFAAAVAAVFDADGGGDVVAAAACNMGTYPDRISTVFFL